jgi:hypothetical protein
MINIFEACLAFKFNYYFILMNNSTLKERDGGYNRQERLAKLTEKITHIQVK